MAESTPADRPRATGNEIRHAAVVVAVSLCCLAYLFRPFQRSFWTTGMGDWMDPYFINYLLEHWYHSVTTLSDPASPPMYFPVRGTLGYSHTLVLYAPFYVPIRLFFHPFPAYSLTLFAVIETGILCLYLLLRKGVGLPVLESLLLMLFLLTSSNALDGSVSVWSQRASVFLIPPVLVIGVASHRARDARVRAVGGGIAGLLGALPGTTRRAALVLMAISVAVLLMPVNVGGFSIWMTVFRPLPGFSVIRDPSRVIYVYELAAVLATAWLLTRIPPARVYRTAATLVLLVLIAADYNRDVFERYRPRDVYSRRVEAPVAVDPACRSFFIKGATPEYMSRSPHRWTLYAIDAMFVALNHSLPTLNGYSAWYPEGWNLWNPQEADYTDRVRRWIERNGLTGVCELDVVARTMRPL
jgi:hypothetical protein